MRRSGSWRRSTWNGLGADWIDPEAGEIKLSTYAEQWLRERPVELRPRTQELYRRMLRLHILPTFGDLPLKRIASAAVRTWHADLRSRGLGESTVAKSYRLLKGIMATAVEDDLILRNPCRIRRAGAERARGTYAALTC